LVVPRSVGSHPFVTSGEHPVKTNAPAIAKPEIEVIVLRRLPVRFCELTDGPSYLLLLLPGCLNGLPGTLKVLLLGVELTVPRGISPTCLTSVAAPVVTDAATTV
jgi:hypothetical protein